MKEKILAGLKTKFQGVQDAALGRIADKLSKTVTSEDEVDNAVSGVTFQQVIDSEADNRVSSALSTYEKKHNLKEGKSITDPEGGENIKGKKKKDGKDVNDEDDEPKWVKELKGEITSLKNEKKQQTLQEKLHAKLKEKKIPLHLAKGVNLNDEAEIETALSEIETGYNEIRQDILNEESKDKVPGGGTKIPGKELDAKIKSWAESKKQEKEQLNKK